MRTIFGKSFRVVGALSAASLALMLVSTPGKAAPGGIVAAGSNGDQITLGTDFLSVPGGVAQSQVGVCNPNMSLTNGTNVCPTFTLPQYVGTATSPFPKNAAQNLSLPWTSDPTITDPGIVVNNNSNYVLSKVVYSNLDPSQFQQYLQPADYQAYVANPSVFNNSKFSLSATNSSSDIFNVAFDPNADTLTFFAGNGKPGLLPGQNLDIVRHFTIPQDLTNTGVVEQAQLYFTPVGAVIAAVPESSSPVAILAVAALGTVSLLKHKSKNS